MRSPPPTATVPLFLALIATGAAGAAGARAQTPTEGATIRVTVADRSAIYELRAIRGDTLLAESPDAILRIPLASLTRLEVGTPARIDRTRRTTRYSLVGAGIGLVLGGIVGAASAPEDDCESFCAVGNMEPAVHGMGIGVMVGGVTGALVGIFSHPGWSWRVVDTDALALRVGPETDALGLRLSWRP